eukprot:1156421-Pelagomonas_calceolata.AAC.8
MHVCTRPCLPACSAVLKEGSLMPERTHALPFACSHVHPNASRPFSPITNIGPKMTVQVPTLTKFLTGLEANMLLPHATACLLAAAFTGLAGLPIAGQHVASLTRMPLMTCLHNLLAAGQHAAPCLHTYWLRAPAARLPARGPAV